MSHPRLMMKMSSAALFGAVLSMIVPSVAGADGFSSKSAEQIFKSAVAASGAASSFSVHGDIRQPKMNLVLNLSLSASGTSEGTLTINGGKVEIREIAGTGYFKGDSKFWTKNGSAASAQLLAGKWVYAPVSDALFSGFRSFLSPRTFIKSFFGSDTGPYSKGSAKVVDGEHTIGVMADGPGTMYVATGGPHFIVNVRGTEGSASVMVTFGSYGVAVNPVKPVGAISLKGLENGSSASSTSVAT